MRPTIARLLQLLKIAGLSPAVETSPSLPRYEEIRRFLLTLDMPDDPARRYLEIHLDRLAVSLSLIPAPARRGSALELGCYMQMAPTLSSVLGYQSVVGAYFGELGKSSRKTVTAAGRQIFECQVDLFNAELDRFPYADNCFDCVLACEIFEHFLHDPVHMLVETWRVLDSGGYLLLTTPNVASATAVARVLEQSESPQLYSKYADPRLAASMTEVGHMREYTPAELQSVLEMSGFDIVHLFTRNAPGYESQPRVNRLLHLLGYSTSMRGEQIFCLARKASRGVGDRFPGFLYER